jgi:hypothetical protein
MDNTRYLLSIKDRLEDNVTIPLGGVTANVVMEEPEVADEKPNALLMFDPDWEWKFSGQAIDIKIPITQGAGKEGAKGIPTKRDRSDSTRSPQSNWSGKYWYERFDFQTPAHHQIAEKIIKDDLHEIAVKYVLMRSPLPKVPSWAFWLAPEEEYLPQ